ncbi:MAG: lipoyl(octanoyl) transferase LipB [Ferroplasma sp.]
MQQTEVNYYTDLGTVEYTEAMELQHRLVLLRKDGKIPNIILFLDHPDVYTIGRKSDAANYKNVNVIRADRGGDVTFHGRGQLVSYFIFDIRIDGKPEVGILLKRIESAYLNFLKLYGYEAELDKEPGIWIRHNGTKLKIASLGMAVDNYISYHGMAMNISSEAVKGFQLINPCGMNSNVISFVDIPRDSAITGLIDQFKEIYGNFKKIELKDILD